MLRGPKNQALSISFQGCDSELLKSHSDKEKMKKKKKRSANRELERNISNTAESGKMYDWFLV